MSTDEQHAAFDRLRTLSRFIRSQAGLTDERSPRPGPGEVRLNHEAALLCADVLDAHLRETANRDSLYWSYDTLAEFFKRHGIISKAMPLCFVCGGPSVWPPPKQHAELPNMIVCDSCLNARSEGFAHAS